MFPVEADLFSFTAKMAPEPIFLSTKNKVYEHNVPTDFDSKHLRCPAFLFISCFQFFTRKSQQKKMWSSNTWDAVSDSHSANKTSPSSLSAETSTALWLSEGHLPSSPVGRLKCYRSTTAVQSQSHAYLALSSPPSASARKLHWNINISNFQTMCD